MLVLSRRIKESLVIQDRIIITVLAVEGDKVKLGIIAPRDVSVLREELWQAAEAQKPIDAGPPTQLESHSKDNPRGSARPKRPGKEKD